MPKLVRLSDIADHIGVSAVTVSKALSGKKGMSGPLRERIRDTAAQMGYEASRSERRNETGNIGILIRQRYLTDTRAYYWDVYRRLLEILQNEGYFGILELVSPEDEKNPALPRLLQEKKCKSIIAFGNFDHTYRRFIAETLGESLVFLDSDETETRNTCIISDSYSGMYAMTKYLISMGHRNIRYLGSIDASGAILDRYYGYCRALREKGLAVLDPIPDRDENGVTVINLPEAQPEVQPSAFVCNCDFAAAHLIRQLREQNLDIPGDISVVGFDDFVFPGYCNIPLTTWATDMDAMVRASVDYITGKAKRDEPRTLIISGHMVIRDSVKPITPLK